MMTTLLSLISCVALAAGVNHLKADTGKHHMSIQIRRASLKEIKAHKPSDDDCIFTNKLTVVERLKRYPFSKASRIFIVSYRAFKKNRDILIDDTLPRKPDTSTAGLDIYEGKLRYSSIIEIKQLNQEQINNLTNIIYNTNYRKPSAFSMINYSCFNPRNAVIFYDKEGKIFDYLQVCFECQEYRSQSEKIDVGTYCDQKFDLLKQFFLDVGLKYGTIRTD